MADFPIKFDLDYELSIPGYGSYDQSYQFQQYFNHEHTNSDCLSSVMNCLPPSSECSACPLSVSKFFYSNTREADFSNEHDNYNGGLPRSQITGRSSLPARVSSEPPNFYSASPHFSLPYKNSNSGRSSAPPPTHFKPKGIESAKINMTHHELDEGDYQIIYKESCSQFTQKMMCFFSKNGSAPLDCEICKSSTTLKIYTGKNAQTTCNHYIPCNECRGRTVRRLLRCVSCCLDLSSEFPVCGNNCVDTESGKETLNTGTCPRCDKKLRREVCGNGCTRRNSEAYNKLRAQLNEKVAVLVLNPTDCLAITKSGVSRPCSHYSYCAAHNIICKGHGRDTTCRLCRGKKKLEKRRASLELKNPPKRQCLQKI